MRNSRVRDLYPKVDNAASRVPAGFLYSSSGEAIMECDGWSPRELERAEPQLWRHPIVAFGLVSCHA